MRLLHAEYPAADSLSLVVFPGSAAVLPDGACFVTGIPDERRGERLVMLYTSPSVTPGDIVNHLQNAGLPPLWIPKRDQIFFVDSIPLLGTGKTDLGKARAIAMEKTAHATFV